ncbi:cholesterol esterase [Tieghemiomyces parasiticus]|uniref:Cholesterol esterase n=1 Tax=Tieghemiomyces parasiticus TaxID=78921 RepID=A0A9W8DP26_9FUNG|nr:cholesterol esterase [Tieghemiomyces parasiticus]
MFRIPILGRLSFMEYQSLVLTAIFILVERIISFFIFFIPVKRISRMLSRLTENHLHEEEPKHPLVEMSCFNDMVEYWGYAMEEHTVVTRDGYVLGIHRLPGRPNEATEGPNRPKQPVVLLWHGFMMSSEVFMCVPDKANVLPLLLADAGYDVWLGNSRGNKYSYRHLTRRTWQNKFWDFSLDELAMFDVPDTVDYILAATGVSQLAYVGFSQGTCQMFCSLSSNVTLNRKVSVFVALAPATTPRGFDSDVVNAMIKTSPQVLYLLLGRREALTIALTWQDLLPVEWYVGLLDVCLDFLFGWKTRNISQAAKTVCYKHLYSFSSVKTIVHWMQIIRTGKLQFYDELPVGPSTMLRSGHICHRYLTRQIQTRIALFHGGQDSLSSAKQLIGKELRSPVHIKEIPHYEHLDFLWADDLRETVLNDVMYVLKKFGSDTGNAAPQDDAIDLDTPRPERVDGQNQDQCPVISKPIPNAHDPSQIDHCPELNGTVS